MVDENSKEYNDNLKRSIEDIIGAKTSLRKVRKTAEQIKKEDFASLISLLDEIATKQLMLSDLGIDLGSYTQMYEEAIEQALRYSFSEKQYNVINFYLYDRFTEAGEQIGLQHADGKVVYLDTPLHLYEYITAIK